jgi:hypothetical protein
MRTEFEVETGLPMIRFQGKEDFVDPEKIGLFWSKDPKDAEDEIRKRIGLEKGIRVFYLGHNIPTPEGLNNRCGDCGQVITESRDFIGSSGNDTFLTISRSCCGPCVNLQPSFKHVKVPSQLIRNCFMFVRIP